MPLSDGRRARGGPPAPERRARIVYVHGRPAPHPNRLRLLPSVGAELVPTDFRLPWAHDPAPPRWRKALSLLVCAARFPRRREWDLVIGDGPQHLPVVMKSLGLLGRRQRIVPYVAGEFPYFLATGYYGRKTALLRWWFGRWDAYLCVGPMMTELVRQALPPSRHGDVFTIQNFVRDDRLRELGDATPPLDGPRLLFVGHGPAGFRAHYKGLDLMALAVARAGRAVPGLEWSIAGDWAPAFREALERAAGLAPGRVRWLGPAAGLRDLFAAHALYLHCARGDAWPNTVMEAMVAGVPALVSEWTGARELVAAVDRRLVAPVDPAVIAERIVWYFSLSPAERRGLGERGREVVRTGYTEARAIQVFRAETRRMLDHLGLRHLSLPPWPPGPACVR